MATTNRPPDFAGLGNTLVRGHSIPIDELGRRRRSRSAQFLTEVANAVRQVEVPQQVESTACHLLVEHLRAQRAYYLELCEAGNVLKISRNATRNGATSLVGEQPADDFAWGLAILRRGHCVVLEDTAHASLVPEVFRVAAQARQIVSCVAAPVIRDGRLRGALCVTDARARRWRDSTVLLVHEVAERLWDSIMRTLAEQSLHKRAKTLERQTVQLRRLASELTLAEHSTRQMLSRVLHDGLQQQLFSASLMLAEGIRHAGEHDALRRAQTEIKSAMDVTRSLSVDLFPPVLHNEDLPDALDWIVSWARKNYDLQVRVVSDPSADPDSLETRILLFESVRELIFNAVKHAHVSELEVSLTLLADHEIQVIVADDGVGFDADRVFDGASSEPGLGLFSIRERLALLGGSMTIQSVKGQGSRFTLIAPKRSRPNKAPASPAPVESLPETAAALPIPAHEKPDCRLRILLVDDHALVRDGLRQLISVHPELEVVEEAFNGKEAIEKTLNLKPDVVVMDVSMPVMDGVGATRAIKSVLPGVEIYGLSMNERKGTQAIERAGASAYFSKRDQAQLLVQRLVVEHRRKCS